MTRITENNTIREIMTLPELGKIGKYMMYTPEWAPPNPDSEKISAGPLSALAEINWSPEGIVSGVNFLLERIEEGRVSQHFIYDETACREDPGRKDVNLIQIFPKKPDPSRPYIMLCAGGAYYTVCTLVEALPAARHMTEEGYTVFLMTYRVFRQEAAIAALEDLAEAFRYLAVHKEELKIDPDRYAIGGFSAGANLVCNWGSPVIGYKKFAFAKPLCLIPVYTFVDLVSEAKRDEKGGLVAPMLGENWRELMGEFLILNHIDGEYPPCYLVCGKDDTTVPCSNSELMKEKLLEAGVPVILEEGEHAEHGFGDGTGTDVEGWPERAVAFLKKMTEK